MYRNGIIGIEKVLNKLSACKKDSEEFPGKIIIVTKGLGFAPAVLLIENLKTKISNGNCSIELYIDKDKIGDDIIKDYLPEDFAGKVGYVDLAKEFAHKAHLFSEDDSDSADKYKKCKVVVLTSDYYISEMEKCCHIDARSNNFRLCCGEGICGACSRQDKNGNVFKMCKCKAFTEEL